MELKLKIYKNQTEVEKEVVVDTYDLMTGTTEEFLNAIDIDKLSTKSNNELYVEIGKFVVKNPKIIRGLIHDIFGISEDEYRRTKVKEIGAILLQFLNATCEEISKLASGKN